MEVFVQFLKDNMALVVITIIALVGVIGLSATLITFKIKGISLKSKPESIDEKTLAENTRTDNP